MPIEPLTERERQALEHLQKAQELEVTVAEYARSFSVDVKELYSAKQSLVRKGVFVARGGAEEEDEVQPDAQLGDFVPVKMVASSSSAVCCIRHPSGLVIECASFPPVEWLSLLLGGAHVPA